MKSAKTLLSQNNSSQTNANGQSSSQTQKSQDNTMALVYPDGRVTYVKVGDKKSWVSGLQHLPSYGFI